MSTSLQKLDAMYQYALHNTHSDFYRSLYGPSAQKRIESVDAWRALPILTRDEIERVPLLKRVFTPLEHVDTFRATSGTSGRTPLITPRIGNVTFSKASENCTGLLIFYNTPHLMTRGRDELGQNFPVVAGSFADAEQSVRLGAHVGINALLCFPFQLQLLVPLLQKYDLAKTMQSIELTGERVSEGEYESLAAIFPNANIFPSYGATELQGIAAYGDEVPVSNQNILRPSPHFYWEVLDESGAVLEEEGAEGALVLTSLNTSLSAFPLLRYGIGDYVRIVAGGTPVLYEQIGRPQVDIVKIPGGMLYAEAVTKALHNIHPDLTDSFQGHVHFQEKKVQLDIHVRARSNKKFTDALRSELADMISTRIQVGPGRTYGDGVAKGLYKKLNLTVVQELFENSDAKRKSFVEHF